MQSAVGIGASAVKRALALALVYCALPIGLLVLYYILACHWTLESGDKIGVAAVGGFVLGSFFIWLMTVIYACAALGHLYDLPLLKRLFPATREFALSGAIISVVGCCLSFALVFLLLSLTASAFDGKPLSAMSAFYFSIITLATVGYGDIMPKSDLARGFVAAEVICSMLYQIFILSIIAGLARDKSQPQAEGK
jgi:hypothetical protein